MSKQAGKNLAMHTGHKILAAPLSRDLRKSNKCRSMPVRKGDKVKILRGDFKGMEGDVTSVDLKTHRITIEKVVTTKADETEVSRRVHASNVMITRLLHDKTRDKILKRRSKRGEERPAEAP